MRKVWLGVWLLASASLAFGQLDSNSLTIVASRTINLQPDQAVFSVSLIARFDAGLDDVLAALQGSGITASNLDGVNSDRGLLQWTFSLPVPISKIKNTIAALTSIQRSVGQQRPGFALNFSVQRMQVSPELLQSQPCSVSDLMSDARIEAQKLATTAGLFLGPVVALSDGPSGPSYGPSFGVPTAIMRTGDFSSGQWFQTGIFVGSFAPLTNARVDCSIVVKFSLIHFQ